MVQERGHLLNRDIWLLQVLSMESTVYDEVLSSVLKKVKGVAKIQVLPASNNFCQNNLLQWSGTFRRWHNLLDDEDVGKEGKKKNGHVRVQRLLLSWSEHGNMPVFDSKARRELLVDYEQTHFNAVQNRSHSLFKDACAQYKINWNEKFVKLTET